MDKRIRRQTKESVGIALERLAKNALRGVGALFGLVVDLEKEGKSEYRECGEIKGKTESGKDIKGVYGFQVKVGLPVRSQEAKAGLNPEEFREQKKLPDGS